MKLDLILVLTLFALVMLLARRPIRRMFGIQHFDMHPDDAEGVILDDSRSFLERFLYDLRRAATDRFDEFVRDRDVDALELFFIQAGAPNLTPQKFYTLRVAAAGLTATLLVFLHIAGGFPAGRDAAGFLLFLPLGIGCTAAAYSIPRFILASRRTRRQRQALAEAPLWMSSLAVLISAGKTPHEAIGVLAEHPGILYAMGRQVQKDIQVGRTLQEALYGMAERVGVPEFTEVMKGLIKSSQKGLPLHQNLETRAEMLHHIVTNRIEERIGRNILVVFIIMVIFALPVFCSVLMAPMAFDVYLRFAGGL